jgi:hypothetical protein
MKKSELKTLIKECIRESIFEEGVLSGIITEVATGMSGLNAQQQPHRSALTTALSEQSAQAAALLEDSRRSVVNAITESSYEDIKKKFKNPDFFEGTTPLTEGSSTGALSNVTAGDPGVDISDLPGFTAWGNVANTKTRK